MLNVAKASKAFYVLTKETSVHISVTFSDNVEEQSALKFLEKNKLIEELNIIPGKNDQQIISLGNHILNSLSGHKYLKVINLKTRMPVNEDHLIKLLQQPNAKHLKKIEIKNFGAPKPNSYPNFDWIREYPYLIEDFGWICHATNLSHLKLGYSPYSYGVNYNTLMNIGKVSKKLVSLRITGNFSNSRSNPILNVTSILKANQKTLKEFEISDY